MIHLFIKDSSPENQVWQNQLKEWCVAHRFTLDETLQEPEIREGNQRIIGEEAINKFLSEYKVLMDEWYDCRCDKWMDQ